MSTQGVGEFASWRQVLAVAKLSTCPITLIDLVKQR